ncbi:MAG: hypothetical protein ACFFEE_00920 [Candidatus Thorarchaeota archaeon]
MIEEEEPQDFELTEVSESSDRVRKIAVGGILASISVAVAPTIGFIARVAGWGIAFFDHVSIFWMISFLIGGPLVGSISLFAGGIALFPFDPFAPFGPIFKIIATLPMMLVPWYGVRRLKSEDNGTEISIPGGETLSRPRFYATLMFLGLLLRLALMIPINVAYLALVAPAFSIEMVINFGIILNISQSLWDALIPFIIVYPTGVFKHFKMW